MVRELYRTLEIASILSGTPFWVFSVALTPPKTTPVLFSITPVLFGEPQYPPMPPNTPHIRLYDPQYPLWDTSIPALMVCEL